MLLSMTGFGRSEGTINNKRIVVELKSLNSKQADVNTRMPLPYRQKELKFRALLQEKLQRGKIELTVQVDESDIQKTIPINQPVVESYFRQMNNIAKNLNIEATPNSMLETVMQFPDVFQSNMLEDIEAEEWNLLIQLITQAVGKLIEFRTQEGQSLEKDIMLRITNIEKKLHEIEPHENGRIEIVKQRIEQSLSEIKNSEKIDKDRFEQELIYYLEKLDITEENVRLTNHCKYFREVIQSGEQQLGRKLNFVSQEIGREINTIGSKAGNAEIQQLVVGMKDELEKVKEQLLNVL